MITKALYKSIWSVLSAAKVQIRLTNNWQNLHDEYGIGRVSPCTKWLQLSSTDRMELVNWVVRQTGADPRHVSYEQAISRSRTQVAEFTNEEKGISSEPRSDHVELRSFNGFIGKYTHSDNGYLGLKVSEIISMPFTYLVTIENFDTFVDMRAEHLPMLPIDKTLLVFRGDNKAHPRAVKKLLEQTTANRVHYGDYDSAGLMIGLKSMGKNTTLVLPDLKQIGGEKLSKLSKLSSFAKQENILQQLERQADDLPVNISSHLQIIRKHNIAVTQQSLMAHQVPLTLLST